MRIADVLPASRAFGVGAVLSRGALVVDRDATIHVPAIDVDAVDTTGVQDAFTAALALFLANGNIYCGKSGNFHLLAETTARYGTPTWTIAAMFAGVLAWEGVAAVLFWRSGWVFRRTSGRSAGLAAFTAALLLWAAFMVADEIFIAYPVCEDVARDLTTNKVRCNCALLEITPAQKRRFTCSPLSPEPTFTSTVTTHQRPLN